MTAVMHMTSQNPNHGQARWASLQLAEKFMKGLIEVIGDVSPIPQTHNLKVVGSNPTPATKIPNNIKSLIP